jgi:hypothetical protein
MNEVTLMFAVNFFLYLQPWDKYELKHLDRIIYFHPSVQKKKHGYASYKQFFSAHPYKKLFIHTKNCLSIQKNCSNKNETK